MTDAEISTVARTAYDAAVAVGLDPAAALDNAGEAVAALVSGRPGFFDQESLTWTSDYTPPETIAEVIAREHEIPDTVPALSHALGVLEGSDELELYARLHARYAAAFLARAT